MGNEAGAAAGGVGLVSAPTAAAGGASVTPLPSALNVSASADDVCMVQGEVVSAVMEGVSASVAAIDALFVEDASLRGGATGAVAGDGVDVLERQYELRLKRMGLVSRLEAQVAAIKARDAAEALELQEAMTPPTASLQERVFVEMSVVEEIAGVLTIGSGAAGAFVRQSRQLCALPPAIDALAAGKVSWLHARIIADETADLDPAAAAALVAHFFDPNAPQPARGAAPGDLVPSRFRHKVRTWRERHHPESLEKRHAKSVADRRVEHFPDRNGMAWISAYLPADSASAIWNSTTAMARGLQGPHETRTLPQRRADVLAHRLLTRTTLAGADTAGSGQPHTRNQDQAGIDEQLPEAFIGLATLVGSDEAAAHLGVPDSNHYPTDEDIPANGTPGAQDNNGTDHNPGSDNPRSKNPGSDNTGSTGPASTLAGKVPAPRTDVLVTVPVFALLGLTDEPAILDGHGPIPASMARELVADGATSFYRVLVDPRDGAPLEIGRTSYRLTKAMKQALRLRDGRCTFPGCNNHSLDNDTDHLTAWQHGGTTGISNLAQLCPKHHRLKHNSAWTPSPATKDQPPGWTSPTGRTYQSEHPDWEPPQWPAGLADCQSEPDVLPGDRLYELVVLEDLELLEDPGLPGWLELPEDVQPPGWFELPEDLALLDLPDDRDVPEDPGVPDVWLPRDPDPGWHLSLAFETCDA
ncbi:HNH endonuclease signature motif containing protein [Arthrobacter sp. Cr_A7]|uniref:HNH endonuclease signature motif containing protein n=1 Tax=Arthrobacter sp. Cr_A7 TaxID=3031017 RepID=UPI0023DB5C3A|nr:HNH endonuclease signature motif containing protein [Arthrobacter sp. Cr_A7]MDF2049721.1 DUF222 domain-containing protein [Arthrobacter sp. Cr_A7]